MILVSVDIDGDIFDARADSAGEARMYINDILKRELGIKDAVRGYFPGLMREITDSILKQRSEILVDSVYIGDNLVEVKLTI